MNKKINGQVKANYMTLSYVAAVLLFCLIFRDEFMGETGVKIAGGVLNALGYFAYVVLGAFLCLAFAKIVFDLRLLRVKMPSLYVLAVLFVGGLATTIDTFGGESFVFGGLMSKYLSMPFRTLFGTVGTSVICVILETVTAFFLIVQVCKANGVNVLKVTGRKAQGNEEQGKRGETAAYGVEDNLRIDEAKSPLKLEVMSSGGGMPREIAIRDMTAELLTETIEKECATVLKHNENSEAETLSNVYVPPKLTLLASEDGVVQRVGDGELNDNANIITSVLAAMKIEARVTDVTIGTSVICFEVEVKNSADIERVERARKALLSRLQIETLTIEAPILGKDRVGINLPNPYRQTVLLKRLLEDRKFQTATNTTVAVGRNISGGVVLCDLAKMPHLLIAGSTGMGKSVCLNAMIVSLLFHADPNEVKLILIDPKRVEFNMYRNIPHLMQEIVCEAGEALEVLTKAVEETERRYKLFTNSNARDVDSYNSQSKTKLPKIIIIIDELAELMCGDLKKEIELQIQRIAQKARAAGVHLVVATQRPSVDVITGVIKSNLPSRIAFKLSNGIDSKTILDESGAEDLLGKGDMYFKPSNFAEKVRVQGAYVTEDEIQTIVNEIQQHMDLKVATAEPSGNEGDAGEPGASNINATGTNNLKQSCSTCAEGEPGTNNFSGSANKPSGSACFVDGTETNNVIVPGTNNLFVSASDEIAPDAKEENVTTAEEESFEAKVWETIKGSKEVSVGIIQGIWSISYTRAINILEQLEAQGLIEQIDEEKYLIVK